MEPTERVKRRICSRLRKAGFEVTVTRTGDLLIRGQSYVVRSYWDETYQQWRLVPYSEPIRQIIHNTVQREAIAQ